jgi:outer membrane lipoprotein-sorting protein
MISRFSFRRWSAVLLCGAVIACGSLPAKAQSNADLEHVLDLMDKARESFRSAEASIVSEQYTSVVQQTDTQKGKVYYRRQGNETQMALEFTDPSPKYVVFAAGKLQLFEPRIDRVTAYDAQKNQDEFESFLVLGFGGGGHAMQKSYDLKYLGTEKIAGVDAAKLDLTPRNPKVQNMFPHIILWIDPARAVSVQQQFFQQGGDYRLSKYPDIQLNRKIADSVFKLKTDSKTTFQNMSSHD